MSLDRQGDSLPMCGTPGSFDRGFHRVEDVLQAAFEYLRQNLFLGIEVVVDAAGLDPRRTGNLAQRGGGISLMAEKCRRRFQDGVAQLLRLCRGRCGNCRIPAFAFAIGCRLSPRFA